MWLSGFLSHTAGSLAYKIKWLEATDAVNGNETELEQLYCSYLEERATFQTELLK